MDRLSGTNLVIVADAPSPEDSDANVIFVYSKTGNAINPDDWYKSNIWFKGIPFSE